MIEECELEWFRPGDHSHQWLVIGMLGEHDNWRKRQEPKFAMRIRFGGGDGIPSPIRFERYSADACAVLIVNRPINISDGRCGYTKEHQGETRIPEHAND
jgi:hypothetical protein